MVLQPRDIALLEKLALLRLLDRTQIAQLVGFKSISRVNVRLAKLRAAGLVVRLFTATNTGSRRAVYGLTKLGAMEVHSSHPLFKGKPDTVLTGNSFASHQLALSEIYIEAANSRSIEWRTFAAPPVPSIPVIPDALISTVHHALFLEMDMRTEPLSVWTRKVDLYMKLALTGSFREILAQPQFSVLVVTNTDARMEQLRRHIAKQTQKLFWFQTLSTIKRQGFWSASWFRPSGSQLLLPGA